MICTIETRIPDHAPVDRFDIMRGQLLTGSRLRAVKDLADSIAMHGLLSPIIAIRKAGRLVVVDGRKRIAALRRLSFEGRMPRSLQHVPYVLTTDMTTNERRTPAIVSNRDLYNKVMADFGEGMKIDALSDLYRVSRQCIRDILTLSRLSPVVRAAFFERLIDFSQARAYAAIPDPDTQLARLKEVGPFATPDHILGMRRSVSETIRNLRHDTAPALTSAA